MRFRVQYFSTPTTWHNFLAKGLDSGYVRSARRYKARQSGWTFPKFDPEQEYTLRGA